LMRSWSAGAERPGRSDADRGGPAGPRDGRRAGHRQRMPDSGADHAGIWHDVCPVAHPLDGGHAAVVTRSVTATAERLGADGRTCQRLIGPTASCPPIRLLRLGAFASRTPGRHRGAARRVTARVRPVDPGRSAARVPPASGLIRFPPVTVNAEPWPVRKSGYPGEAVAWPCGPG
jgi:hypothetical protein